MPDRDYYLRDDKALATTRDAYRAHLAKMLTLGGYKNADARAQAVYNLEVEIAKAHWPAADRRDADKNYNPMKISQLVKFAPGFPWVAFFKAEGVTANGPKGERTVIVRAKHGLPDTCEAVRGHAGCGLARLSRRSTISTTCLPICRRRSTTSISLSTARCSAASPAARSANARRASARYAARPSSRQDLRGALFPAGIEGQGRQLISNILKAYDADIRTIPWMTEVTRQKALDKLHQFTPHVGYPDKWRDYPGLTIKRDDLVGDVERSGAFEWNYRLARMDDSVDRNEWFMTPPTINAYYTQSFNSIFFPAAILQPPFFDPNADDAVNYGGIGAVIGHEISHGFDDQGSKYYRRRHSRKLVDGRRPQELRDTRVDAGRAVQFL